MSFFRHLTHKSSSKVIGFLGLVIRCSPGLDHFPALLPVSHSSMLAILVALSRIPSNDSWVVTATVVSSLLFSSDDVFVEIRRLVFGAVEQTDSFLSSPSTSILVSSVINFAVSASLRLPRLPSICELPLLAAAAAAFMTRLFLGSESGGIGTSFNSCGAGNSPAVLLISSLLLTISLYFFLRLQRSTPVFFDPNAQILLELFWDIPRF